MLGDFLDSWPLVRDATTAAWLAAALLSVAGVIALIRGQVFLGATLAQASTLGIVFAPWLAVALHAEQTALLGGDGFKYSLAVSFAVTAAVVLERGWEHAEQSRSAAIAYGFLLASSVSLLVVAHRADGRAEIERLLMSSAVTAGPVHVALLSLALVAVTALLASSRRQVLLVALDRPTAAAAGMRVGAWSTLLAAGLGAAVGLCVPVAGVLYAFACLLLPALVARNSCREIGSMFAVAPIVAVGSAVIAFVLAHRLDVPPAELTVAVQAFLVIPAWLLRRVRRAP